MNIPIWFVFLSYVLKFVDEVEAYTLSLAGYVLVCGDMGTYLCCFMSELFVVLLQFSFLHVMQFLRIFKFIFNLISIYFSVHVLHLFA